LNWVLRQLINALEETRIVAGFGRRCQITSNTLAALREDPLLGLLTDKKIEPTRISIALADDMGIKNGQGSFVESVQNTLETFYGEVVQILKSWQHPAPQLPPTDVSSENAE
jgi:hypothetical protein